MNKPNYFLGGIDLYATILNLTKKVNEWNDKNMIIKINKKGFEVRKKDHSKHIKAAVFATYKELIMDLHRKFDPLKLETHYNLQTTKTFMAGTDGQHLLSDPKTPYNHLNRLEPAGLLVGTTTKGDFYVKLQNGKRQKRTICCKNVCFPVDIIAFRKPAATLTQTNLFSQEKTEAELLANIGKRSEVKVKVAADKQREDYSAKIAEIRKTKGNAAAFAYSMQLIKEGKV